MLHMSRVGIVVYIFGTELSLREKIKIAIKECIKQLGMVPETLVLHPIMYEFCGDNKLKCGGEVVIDFEDSDNVTLKLLQSQTYSPNHFYIGI